MASRVGCLEARSDKAAVMLMECCTWTRTCNYPMLNILLNQLIINLGKYFRMHDMQGNQDNPSGSMQTNAGEAYQPLKSMSSPAPPGRDAGSIGRRSRLSQQLSVKALPLPVRIQRIKIVKALCKAWGNELAAAPNTLKRRHFRGNSKQHVPYPSDTFENERTPFNAA